MATSADETRQQIEGLRNEVTAILNELEHRGKQVFGVQERVRSTPTILTGAARRTMETNPLALALLGLGVLASLLALVARARRKAAAERQPVARLRRRARQTAEELGEYVSRARESVPFSVHVESGRTQEQPPREDPSMVKKLLWMGLSAGSLALAGLLARRFAATLWEKMMGESPPTAKA